MTGPWDTTAPLGSYLRRAARAGIDRTVLLPAFHSNYREANRRLARIVAGRPAQFVGYAMVHPVRDAGRVAELVREAVEGYGFCGIKVHRNDARITREICEVARAFSLPVLYDVMGEAYPHLIERRSEILDVIAREEAQFARTLDAGAKLLDASIGTLAPAARRTVGRRIENVAADAPTLAGETAFRLHDTYGFPFELTEEYLAEFGIRVDRAGFDVAMAEQRSRSRSGKKAELAKHAELAGLYGAIQARHGDTRFLGYEATTAGIFNSRVPLPAVAALLAEHAGEAVKRGDR